MVTYTYPHVEITQKVLQSRQPTVTESTATRLLAPFVSDRGPSNQLVAIDSYSDFINTFGELDYKKEGQEQILYIGNWIANGGRVCACRLVVKELTYYLYADEDKVCVEEHSDSENIFSNVESGVSLTPETYPTSTTFVWKTSEYSESVYGEEDGTTKEFVKLYYIPSHANSDGKNSVPEFLVERSYQDSGLMSQKYDRYYFALKTIGENEYYEHEKDETSKSLYFNFVNAGLDELSFVYKGTNSLKLKGNLILNINLANVLTISGDTTFTTGIKLIPYTSAASDIATKASAEYTLPQDTKLKISTEARYEGDYYNGIQVSISTSVVRNVPYFTVVLQKNNTSNKTVTLERFNNLEIEELYIIENTSEYLDHLYITYDGKDVTEDDLARSEIKTAISCLTQITPGLTLANGKNGPTDIQSFLVESLTSILNKPLETPFDVFMDAGYDVEVKKDLIKLFCNTTEELDNVVRNDAFLFLTNRVFGNDVGDVSCTIGASKLDNITEVDESTLIPENNIIDGVTCDFQNVAIYRNIHKIEDIFSLSDGKEVYVPTLYFLAGLIPYNDAKYGPQYTVCNITRGSINGSLWVDELPTRAQKQDYYDRHINYIEKDSRGMCYMSQLTGLIDTGDNPLEKINNERALLKIKSELRKTGRNYLHEFNDRITKSNLENALNVILSNWIQNRTLSFANLSLEDSTDDPSLLDTQLKILVSLKFNKTIDIISFDLTIE